MVLRVGIVDGKMLFWLSMVFLVQVITPGGKRYDACFYIRAELSRRELFDTITGRKFN